MIFRYDENNLVYSPSYKSDKDGILELPDLDETMNPGDYLYFDEQSFKTIENLTEYFIIKLNGNNIYPESKIIFQDEKYGDCIKLSTKNGYIDIRIPVRNSPLDIMREYLIVTTKSKNKITTLNQVVKTFNQIFLEASSVL